MKSRIIRAVRRSVGCRYAWCVVVLMLLVSHAGGQPAVRQVADLRPGPAGSFPSNLTTFGSALLFSAYTTNFGRELWKYDGSSVILVSNINDTVRDIGFGVFVGNDSSPAGMAGFQGELYFSAFDPRRGGELWRTDGAGVMRVADINPDLDDTVKTNLASSWPHEFAALNDELFFSADGGGSRLNYELWKFNGLNATLAANIHADSGADHSSYPQGFKAFQGALYFMADDGGNGYELWKYREGTANLLTNINPGNMTSSSYPKYFTAYNDNLYFQAFNSTSGFELWRTDGTLTILVTNLVAGSGSSFPDFLTEFNGALYFRATDNVHGYELWRYDGTRAMLAADINAGAGDSFPKNLTVFRNQLYFSATDGVHGWELWTFDGTNASLVKDLNASGDSFPEQLTIFNNSLCFVATTPSTGYEVWRFNGTTTEAVTSINPGSGNSYPQELTVFGRELCFRATEDGVSNWELWALTGDGRPAGAPVELRDVRWQDNRLTFRFQTELGAEYLVYGSETLVNDGWRLLSVQMGTGAIDTFVDSEPAAARRFYRVESR